MIFKNREEAGVQLAALLGKLKKKSNAIVLGLPRGGVVTAAAVAKMLQLPLDVTCPRKLGAPFYPELAIGAITETGEGIINEELKERLQIPDSYLEGLIEKEKQVAQQRVNLYRKGRKHLDLKGKEVIIVDDGLATGATMKAAIRSVKAAGAGKIIVAVPVSPADTLDEIRHMVDEAVSLQTPLDFQAVGQFYQDFSQTEDQEVVSLLAAAIAKE